MKLIFESSLFGVDSTDQFNTLAAIAIFPKHPVTSIKTLQLFSLFPAHNWRNIHFLKLETPRRLCTTTLSFS